MIRNRFLGFTLIELILTIGIMLLLAALSVPILAPARKFARVTSCTSNLRQIGQAYRTYQVDYDSYPEPYALTHSSYITDPRLLTCPEDWTEVPNGVASSYVYQYLVPPTYARISQLREVDPNVVLAFCDHHLSRYQIHLGNDASKWSQPGYPYYVVVRAGGSATRVKADQVRRMRLPMLQNAMPFIFPNEPGYDSAVPDPDLQGHDHDD